MTIPSQSPPPSLRAQVKTWLQGVSQDARVYGLDLATATIRARSSFPTNAVLSWIGQQAVDAVTKQVVKVILWDAAKSLDISVDSDTLDAMAGVIVEALAAT
jgi:hypothetical protein